MTTYFTFRKYFKVSVKKIFAKRNIKSLVAFIALGIFAALVVKPVEADTILLSQPGWTFNLSGNSAFKHFNVNGVNLEVRIDSEAYRYGAATTNTVTHDTVKGFGVKTDGTTDLLDATDEVYEMLTVTFDHDVTLLGYGMSDWTNGSGFTPKIYNFSPYAEIYLPKSGGVVDVNGYMTFSFTGKPLTYSFIRFFSQSSNDNDGLGLARLDISVNGAPVSEPATMLFLGTGLIGLFGFRRKLKK